MRCDAVRAAEMRVAAVSLLLALCAVDLRGQDSNPDAEYIRSHYAKFEYRIPMRDGVHLFTAVYRPVDRSAPYPFLILRTPYSCRPYGADRYPSKLGPDPAFARDGYIFVVQDVRGRYMSEGEFVNMRPHIARKGSRADIDESTDTYDTIEWLLDNVDGHNGRAGMWGISYPGFYAAAGMIDGHPALRAVSPQAPIADWYFDDFHHHGALFLPHTFNFFARFGKPRPDPTDESPPAFDHGTPDGYDYFLRLGSLAAAGERLGGDVAFWDEIAAHPDYDEFWQARNLLPHLSGVRAAVLTVGGWFDAEDLYGPLAIYRAVEARNPGIGNAIVMGPWDHGGWHNHPGEKLGDAEFGFATSELFRERVQRPFFLRHLKDEGASELPEAYVFETGANRWRSFNAWPPPGLAERRFHLRPGGRLESGAPDASEGDAFDEFISDPAKPVPFTEDIATGMTREYMTDDQRFAARRPDVLAYATAVLDRDLTLAGPLTAELWVSTSESDADWIVKLIDVLPDDSEDPEPNPRGVRKGGYQMMVRSEVIRGRYRDSLERPKPFTPNEPALVRVPLQDVCHTFLRGHRIMVQVQSTWFPLVDRNPQRWVDNIFQARPEDFARATHRVHRSSARPSAIVAGVLPAADEPAPER